jgi:hypothetical protein
MLALVFMFAGQAKSSSATIPREEKNPKVLCHDASHAVISHHPSRA